MLREHSLDFYHLSLEEASVVLQPSFIAEQNSKLGIAGDEAIWLSGDQIIELCDVDNPDGAGEGPSWLGMVGPVDTWREYFDRTVNDSNEHGCVHIAIVNTDGLVGYHWVLVAWYLHV